MSRSYEFRQNIKPAEKIYRAYLDRFGLSQIHRSELQKRGLTHTHIAYAGYVTKASNNSREGRDALAYMEKNFSLDEIPGFFIDDKTGRRNHLWTEGILIPVSDIDGQIVSIQIRNDKPKVSNKGKVTGKYVWFSTEGKNKGGKVYPTTHCPRIKGKPKEVCGITARITEGYLKADIATALGDTYCLGMPGLLVPEDLLWVIENLGICTLWIALDAGEDSNVDMIRSKAKLIRLCQDAGVDFKVEIWSPDHGKGIDDVLKAGHGDKIRAATDEEIKNIMNLAYQLDPYNGEWIYSIGDSKMVHITAGHDLQKQQFADKFRLIKGDKVSEMIAEGKINTVDDRTYWPGKQLYIEENGMRYLNSWRSPGVMPIEGDVSLFLNHVEYLFADKTDQYVLLNFIAFLIQFPGEKIHWMPILLGKPGIGKSFFKIILQGLLGASNISMPSNEQLHEAYTGWQKSCQLVIIEELMGTDRRDLVNKLKRWVTEAETTIRAMYREGYIYPNRFNLIAFTNYDNALPIDGDDRRFCILQSLSDRKDDAYYQSLFDWARQPQNISALYHYFNTRDLRTFNPKGNAPMTTAKKNMIELSMSVLEEFIKNGLEERSYPFDRDVAPIRHLKNNSPRHLRERSEKEWAKHMQKHGAVKYPSQVPLANGQRAMFWLLNETQHILMNLRPAEIAARYNSNSLDMIREDPADMVREDRPL